MTCDQCLQLQIFLSGDQAIYHRYIHGHLYNSSLLKYQEEKSRKL